VKLEAQNFKMAILFLSISSCLAVLGFSPVHGEDGDSAQKPNSHDNRARNAVPWDAIGNFNPVVPGYFADPTLKKFGDTYYLYSSTDGIGACEGWTQVWISKDMVNWVNHKMNWNPRHMNWAPDCMEKDGKYYLFYNFPCMTYGAEGDSPTGPWTAFSDTPLIPDKFVPPVITLDCQTFEDDDGSVYAYFTTWAGNNGAGTGWVKFNEDMKTFQSKNRIPYKQLPGIMEAPYMLKRNGKYYMMYSNGSCHDETYNVQYSIHQSSPTSDTGWVHGENNPILSSELDRNIHGTGHHSVLQEGDKYFIIYHRHDIWVSAGGLTRQTCIDPMFFNDKEQIEKVCPTHRGVGYFGPNQNAFPNLAQGAKVTASSHYGTYFPRYATDDNNATLWRAADGSMNQWIEIDMGSVKRVRRTHLQFEYPEHVYQYLLEYSTDKKTWHVFADKQSNQKSACPMVDDNDVDARYFRVTITNMEPIKNVGRRAAIWNFKAFSGIDPNYEALIKKYVNADLDPPLPPLLLRAENGYGGTISPSGETAAWHKSDHTYTITANPGFTIKEVIVDGKSVGPVSTYSFDNISKSHTMLAKFSSKKQGKGSIPRTKDLLFSCLADSLPAQGEIDSWSTQFPKGGSLASISNPSASLIDGHKFASIAAGDGDGFRFGKSYSSNIDCDGFSIVVALRHRRHTVGDAWNSVVDIFYDRLQLGVYNKTGRVYVRRNGDAQTSSYALADQQIAILSLVVQPNGTYKAFVDDEEIMSSDSTDQMTSLVPGVVGEYGRFITLGRNNPDTWSTFNGDIGDVFLYKAALSDSERQKLVTYIGSKLIDDGVATTPKE
jgi:hypothetical protein